MKSQSKELNRRLSNEEYQKLSVEEKVAYIRRQAELTLPPNTSVAAIGDPGALLKPSLKRS